jgi:tetratricopeptide (TPR) repeat protein
MGLLKDFVKHVRHLPDSIKWITGLVGGLGALAVAFQRDARLLVLAGALGVLVTTGAALAAILVRKDASLLGGPARYRYPRLRRPAGFALFLLTACTVVALSVPGSRARIADTLFPRQTADILVVELDGRSRTEFDVGHRIQDDLERRLRRYGLGNEVVVALTDSAVLDAHAARRIGQGYRAKAVVWGWRDALGVTVNIALLEQGHTTQLPGVSDQPLQGREGHPLDASVVFRDQIPRSISFLSLYVLGHVFYESNRFQAGHAAFDAAMNTMPANMTENQAITAFFQARRLRSGSAERLQTDTSRLRTDTSLTASQAADDHVRLVEFGTYQKRRDHTEEICLYANAIRQHPQFYEAYNNLGIALSNVGTPQEPGWFELADAADCLERIGLRDITPADAFRRAIRLNPRSAVLRYNLWADQWKNRDGETWEMRHRHLVFKDHRIERELKRVVRDDSTVWGAHVVLGMLAFDRDEPRPALAHFSAAHRLNPLDARIVTNLGQTYLRLGQPAQARERFRQALVLNPRDAEASLALAALSVARPDQAEQHLVALRSADTLKELRTLITSESLYRAGRAMEARMLLRDLVSRMRCSADGCGDWATTEEARFGEVRYELYLYHLFTLLTDEQVAVADSDFTRHGLPYYINREIAEDYLSNHTAYLAWYDLVDRCVPKEEDLANGVDDSAGLLRGTEAMRSPLAWGVTNPCLPNAIPARIDAAYAALHRWLACLLYFRVNLPKHDLG